MALSPNYSWAEPDNSSLVKNGASDIRTLGDAIDTSVWNVGYGQAGKNKLINGDFGIWQRGTSQSVIEADAKYGSADRWLFGRNGTTSTGTNTVSRETFTVGQTDVPNNPTYYCRWTTTTLGTSQTRIDVNQYIENVGTFAGQTATLSFYIKSSGTFGISTFVEQNFGSGGSATVTTTTGTGNTSTLWQRFTTTIAVPSISGKTVGASNYLRILIRVNSPTAGATFDFANAQIEYGSKATPFQLAGGGDPQSELAMCQRYYEKSYDTDTALQTNTRLGLINIIDQAYNSTSTTGSTVLFKVTKRGTPTITLYREDGSATNPNYWRYTASTGGQSYVAFSATDASQNGFMISTTSASGLTAGYATRVSGHYVASSEL